MIDLGLTKLAVIGVVALIVIGPEKLPKVARMAGTLYGRAQRYLNEVKSEVSREIELEELRNLQKEVQETAPRPVEVRGGEFDFAEYREVENAWHDSPAATTSFNHHVTTDDCRARRASSGARSWCAIPLFLAGTSSATAASCT
jgi:sec-independent protein translocase protein TatB